MSKEKQKEFLTLYKPIHDSFERFCRARAYSEMPYADLMNESLLLAYQKLDQFNKSASFLSFLIGISIRLLANSRKKKRTERIPDQQLFMNFPDPSGQFDKQFDVELLHKALAHLPQLQREAIILFEINGFQIKEIMNIQHSTEASVKQRLSRGRKALKQIISKELDYNTDGKL